MGWFRNLKLFADLSRGGRKDAPVQRCLCRGDQWSPACTKRKMGDQWSPLQGRCGFLLLLILAFLLTSCAHGAPRAPQIPADFAATVEVVRGDFTYSADYTRCGGAETLHFTAPDSLAGLCAATADGGCTLSVGGVTATVPTGGIFAPFALFDAPDGCLTESRADGGLTVYAGRCGDDVYSIAVDGAGVPVRLSGSVGGSAAEIRVLKFAQISPPAGEEGNAHE